MEHLFLILIDCNPTLLACIFSNAFIQSANVFTWSCSSYFLQLSMQAFSNFSNSSIVFRKRPCVGKSVGSMSIWICSGNFSSWGSAGGYVIARGICYCESRTALSIFICDENGLRLMGGMDMNLIFVFLEGLTDCSRTVVLGTGCYMLCEFDLLFSWWIAGSSFIRLLNRMKYGSIC